MESGHEHYTPTRQSGIVERAAACASRPVNVDATGIRTCRDLLDDSGAMARALLGAVDDPRGAPSS